MKKKKTPSRPSRRWPDHLRRRLRAVRGCLDELGVEAILINHQVDIRYLTGFASEDSWLVIDRQHATLLSDRRFEEELKTSHAYVRSVMRQGTLEQALGELMAKRTISRIGFQAEHVTVAARKKIVRQIGAKAIKPIDDVIGPLRIIKDDYEVDQIRQAVKIQERAFELLCQDIRVGMTEQAIDAQLTYHMRCLGADGPSFQTIVAVDANASMPHYEPKQTKIKKNSAILIDFGAKYNGYCSDMTRVVAVGRMKPKIAEIYQIVQEAYQAGVEAAQPGALLKDVDHASRQVIEKAGYGPAFGHSLGHGIGLDIHEMPRLASVAKGRLAPGHVVTIEPGIYLPGIGGVRLEDDILITESGCQNLCQLPMGVDSAIIAG